MSEQEEVVLRYIINILNANLLEPVTILIKELKAKELVAKLLPELIFNKCLSDDDFMIFEIGIKLCQNLIVAVPDLRATFEKFCEELFPMFCIRLEHGIGGEFTRHKEKFIKLIGQLYAYNICSNRRYISEVAIFFMNQGDEVHIEYLRSLCLQLARCQKADTLHHKVQKRMDKMKNDSTLDTRIRNLIDEALVAIQNKPVATQNKSKKST